MNKKHILPIILVLLGIIDQGTGLFAELLMQINAPIWAGTLFKIIVISLGAIKIYLIDPKK